jgi:hypothetical protein
VPPDLVELAGSPQPEATEPPAGPAGDAAPALPPAALLFVVLAGAAVLGAAVVVWSQRQDGADGPDAGGSPQ